MASIYDQIRSGIAYGNYMNAQSEINRLEKMKQDEAVAAELQKQQEKKMAVGQDYLNVVNAIREKSGQEPFTGWPEEAMGPNRRVYATDDRMGYPLTPEQEAMYAQASPRKVVPLTQDEIAAMKAASTLPDTPSTEPSQYEQVGGSSGNPRTSPSRVNFLGGSMVNPPKVEVVEPAGQPAKKSDFIQTSNIKRPPAPKTPKEEYEELVAKGEIGNAHQLEYDRQQAVYQRNIAKIMQASEQVAAQTGSYEEGSRFRKFYMEMAEQKRTLKPIQESAAFKGAQAYTSRAGFHQTRDSIAFLGEQIKEVREMIAAGKKESEVIAQLQVNIPKIMQSLGTGQSDAVQEAEARRLMPELQTILGQGVNVNDWLKLLSQKDFVDTLTKQPKDFLDKAERVYAAAVKGQNATAEAYRKQIGDKAAAELLLSPLPTSVGGNDKNKFKAIRDAHLRAMQNAPQQQGQQGMPQQPPPLVGTQMGIPSSVSPSSVWFPMGQQSQELK
jgi:hypothetical protein